MDVGPLEDFAIDFGVVLAGWTLNGSEDLVPLDANQVGIVMIAAVAQYARTRPDYDPDTVITSVVKMGVYAYGQATEANFLEEAERLQGIQDESDLQDLLKEEPERTEEEEEGHDTEAPPMDADQQDRASDASARR